MYEPMSHRVIPRKHFAWRVLRHFALAAVVAAFALVIGIVGYHYLDELSWLDAFVNASMILGGMGPVDTMKHPSAKLFAGFYALFSGVIFIGVAGVVVAPFAHRLLHHFHFDDDDAPESG